MAARISWVCRVDHAVKRGNEPVATVTVHRGQWAYCPRGDRVDCIWEAIEPTTLEQLRALPWPVRVSGRAAGISKRRTTPEAHSGADDPSRVDLICVTAEHVESGKRVPDGEGTLTVQGRLWAYCTAGLLNAPHDWKETGGVPFDSIRHAALPVSLSSS